MTSTASRRRTAQAGFTLIELMVALGLSMILAIVLLKMQAALGQQRMRTSDIAERDTEVRAAMDVITQDMSGTAFLFGNSPTQCDAIFSYYSAPGGPRFFTRHQVDAIAASNGATMNFASNLTLNYPTGSMPSDVLVITSANDASNFNDTSSPINAGMSAATDPLNTGVMQLAVRQTAPVVGHMAIVEASMPKPGTVPQTFLNACIRVPVSEAAAGNTFKSYGVYMPTNFYAGFQPSLTAAGFGTLGNGELASSAKFIDVGLAGAGAAATQTTTAYYIDNNNGSFPVLMRSRWNLLDDTAIGTPQQVAAGVVSLQARFNTGLGNYQTAAAVSAANLWSQVCSVRVAIVTRSINDDPDPSYVWTPTTITPGTAALVKPALAMTWGSGSTQFSDVPVSSDMQHRRFLLQTTELAIRNTLWTRGVAQTC
jgi:type IV pilus assembly protein PilW